MVRLRRAVILGLVIGVLGVTLRPTGIGLRLEEDVGLRWLFAVRGPLKPPPDVVVVTIDRGSAQQLGLDTREWPPPRHVHASVIRALHSRDVSAIIMDIRFEKHRSPTDDDDLADAIAKSGNVALAQHIDRLRVPGVDAEIEQIHSPIDQLQKSAISLAPFPVPEGPLTHFFWTFFETVAGEVPTLPAAALQIQALPIVDRFVTLIERAGVKVPDPPDRITSAADLRRFMEAMRHELINDPHGAARALALLDAGEGGLSATERRVFAALLRLYAGSRTYYLNFYGPAGTIETIPFHELLQDGRGDRFDLAGKAVFVGEGASGFVTSAEQPDTYPTVYSTSEGVDLSGAEIGATALANLLTDRVLRPVSAIRSVAILLGVGIVVGILTRLLPGVYAAAIVTAVGAAYCGLAQFLFADHARLIPVAIPVLVQLPLALFVGIYSRYRDIRKQVPIEMDPSAPLEEFQGVCLATDVKGYTSIAEAMKPNELAALLDDYYDMLRGLVARRRGLTWGRAGDSTMCVWKGPRADRRLGGMVPSWLARHRSSEKEARLNACLAAIEMRDAIDRFNQGHAATRQLPTRIGLDAGQIAFGPVAGELQAVGSPANTAARIEDLNKVLSTKVLASERVVHDLEPLVLRRLGLFHLSGKSSEVLIFEILGHRGTVGEVDTHLCESFAAGLALYEKGNWSDAAKLFQQLALERPADGPTEYYRGLCQPHASAPLPPDRRPTPTAPIAGEPTP